MASVKLLSLWASPFAMRVRLALDLKGISYELIEEDLSNKSELLLQSNPVHKKLPVLIHGGKPVCESSIIVEYIDEAWPDEHPFFPKDPLARSKARFWGAFLNNEFTRPVSRLLRSGGTDREAQEEFIKNCMLLEELAFEGEGPFLGGESMGYADIMLSPIVVLAPAWESELGFRLPAPEICPKMHRLFQAIVDHPAAAAPRVDDLRAYVRKMFKKN